MSPRVAVAPALPLLGSLALHAILLSVAAAALWRLTGEHRGADRFMSFENPALGSASPTALPPLATPGAAVAPAPPLPSVAPVPVQEPPRPVLTSDLAPEASPAGAAAAPALRSALAPDERALPATDVSGVPGTPPSADVTFAGLGASSARSVVYVVDASGPMVTSLPLVLAEVHRSVSRLSPSQRFTVILFRALPEPAPAGDPGYGAFTSVLVRATGQAKERLAEWLGAAQPAGRSNPLDGLKAAIDLHPDSIFLLSRSIERSGGGVWEYGLDRTLEELDRLNPADPATGRRPIVVKTIQFLDPDPTGIMQEIGRLHGQPQGTPSGAAAGAGAGYTLIRRTDDLAGR